MTVEEKNKALDVAWKKIHKWVNKEVGNLFVGGKKFRLPHNAYYWMELVVTEDGDARLCRGDHSSSRPRQMVYLDSAIDNVDGVNSLKSFQENINARNCKRMIDGRKYINLELLVINWDYIKTEILAAKKTEKSVYSFKP